MKYDKSEIEREENEMLALQLKENEKSYADENKNLKE